MKGQVSVETLIAVIILFVILGMILVYNLNIQESERVAKEAFESRNECLKLAYVISQVYAEGNGAEVILELERDSEIFAEQRTVKTGQNFCGFLSNIKTGSETSLTDGTIRLVNEEMEVNISYLE